MRNLSSRRSNMPVSAVPDKQDTIHCSIDTAGKGSSIDQASNGPDSTTRSSLITYEHRCPIEIVDAQKMAKIKIPAVDVNLVDGQRAYERRKIEEEFGCRV